MGHGHLLRVPHRSFSEDESPYKDHQGALATTAAGMGYDVQLSADGLTTGGGFYPTGPDQLPRLRAAVRREHGAPPWLTTPQAVEHVRADWRRVRPLVTWLTEHVGAATRPRTR